jgi:hypothetical protein
MARAGRKRKAGVKRTASGRISRSKDAYQEHLPGVETRMRIFGLSEKDARDQKAETPIGRMQLRGDLSTPQYEAAQEVIRLREAFQRAVKSPDAMRSSGGGGDQGESATYAAWCKGAIKKYEDAVKALMAEQSLHAHRGSNFMAAIDYMVYRNEYHEHMVGDTRVALNALAHHFGILVRPKRKPLDGSGQIAA